MLRIVHLTILPGMLLTTCIAWVNADTTKPNNRAAVENKQIYSNRPAGYTMPVPYYGTPMAPRFVAPPTVQYRSAAPAPVAPVVAPIQAPPASRVTTPQVIERTFILPAPQPEVNVNDELDTFYARMAKIHLEKRQLAEALALIQKINSETFKVRTVVSLAEYVSRDKNYQSEAEQLFRLAIAGIEALDRKQPFRIDIDGVKDVPQPVGISPPDMDTRLAPTGTDLVPPLVPIPPVDTGTGASPRLDPLVGVPPDVGTNPLPVPPDPSPTAGPSIPVPRPQLLDLLNNGEDAERNNGRRPAPPPPRGNGVDGGVVVSPPENPSDAPEEAAPPARTEEEDNGRTPPTPPSPIPLEDTSPPENEVPPPDSSTTTVVPPTVPVPLPPFVRPTPIPLDDKPMPEIIQDKEADVPMQPPVIRRRPPPRTLILEEN